MDADLTDALKQLAPILPGNWKGGSYTTAHNFGASRKIASLSLLLPLIQKLKADADSVSSP